ncbi:hypothetical protein [Streptomyces inhibens]|uniref:hypothetical protein n=1 Tax=Streptomyces inhibens TaxID=2293571 RepID=UPI001EE73B59|nr:hypothetical protein [Streptomyces inhibens]UKY47553.1 hypothetical protein KI385_00930 [Streptomyces inhibens]
MKKSAIAGGCILGLLIIVGACKVSAATNDPLTLAEFDKIKAGSSEKTLLQYASTCQQDGEAEPAHSDAATWTCFGADGSSNAVFFYSEGELFSKAQTGLV